MACQCLVGCFYASLVVSIGKCSNGDWAVFIKTVKKLTVKQSKLSQQEKEIAKNLKLITKQQFKPVLIEESRLKTINNGKLNFSKEVIILQSQMPNFAQDFFNAETAKSMEFVISSGVFFTYDNTYKEMSRYTVKVSGTNPTIAEILKEVLLRI